ncbi:hypothetical protein HMPREF9138_01974 [Prevotella histicola F0411]|uniref:Uncharacterized protein n=1 Tax=Prevotella histicola F0411 TaxID=857291 RepID=G6AIP7_9BACT|nr:hypothetical protein HMPREF9138_01974 [Prevotella histicola F0411]
MYDKKVADGYEVLEISKGAWTEAIFAKEKPMAVVTRTKFPTPEELSKEDDLLDNDDEDLPEDEDEKKRDDEDDEDYDEDKLTEESYRTTFDTNPEELDIQADEVGDDDDF